MYNLFILLFSADHLSMETLLSMTSKRAGEWFKEELRELGGLDHLVRTSSDCLNFLVADEISMWTEPLHNKLRKTGRVLKVLESVRFEYIFVKVCMFYGKICNGIFIRLGKTGSLWLWDSAPRPQRFRFANPNVYGVSSTWVQN